MTETHLLNEPPPTVPPPTATADNLAETVLDAVVRRLTGATLPHATYRVQFNAGFTFRHARELVPYWARLGISHIYASPFLKANAGSMHGYDVVDHTQLNPE